MSRANPKKLGNLGERIAVDYLKSKGYRILNKNCKIETEFSSSFGEIDIIAEFHKKIPFWKKDKAKEKKVIHFVEVKTISQNENFEPEDRVDFKKQRKLIKLAQIWLNKNKVPFNSKWQIDVIGIKINPATGKAKVRHFKNAIKNVF